MPDKRERLQRAGEWLRIARRGAGYDSVGSFARALGVDPSMVSRYERGMSEVSDERAEQIAHALRMNILDVRQGLGMWTPSNSQVAESPVNSVVEHLRQIERLAQQALLQLAPGEDRRRDRASA